MSIGKISNGEAGSSVREKLNKLLDEGASAPTISVADAAAMQAIIDAGTVEIGQLFSLVSDRSIRRYEGGSKSRIVSDLPQGNPTGYLRATSIKTSNISGYFKHDGGGGVATGICYSVDGGTPVYTAVAADTLLNITTIPHNNGAPVEIAIWPASSASSGRVGNFTYIGLAYQSLTSVDVSGLTALTYLSLTTNQLTSLDVSGLTALAHLGCSSNKLTSLDVSGLTSLTYLQCTTNQLTSLDVSGLTSLEDLYCNNNQLTFLDVSGLTALDRLDCYLNNLTSLDVSGLSVLRAMSCQSNQLTSLNVAGTALEILYCHSNQLTSLDVSGLTVLETLYCYINQLSSLDVSSLTALETLYCFSNQLTSLNVAGLTALERIRCYSNNLTSLTLGSGPYHYVMAHDNPALTDLSVGDDFDAQGGYSMGYHGVYSQDGVTLHNTALSGATLNAFYQKLTATPTSGYYGAGYIYLKNVEDPGTNPCVGWDSDNPSLAPVAWTIYGT